MPNLWTSNLAVWLLAIAAVVLSVIPACQSRKIIVVRHAEGPDIDNTQYHFSSDDDLDPVGYLRSLCLVSVFGKNHTFPLRPAHIITQNPKHSRRSPETALPLAAHLHLPISSCCHKDQLVELSDHIGGLEPWQDPVIVFWWGRIMPNMTAELLPEMPRESVSSFRGLQRMRSLTRSPGPTLAKSLGGLGCDLALGHRDPVSPSFPDVL